MRKTVLSSLLIAVLVTAIVPAAAYAGSTPTVAQQLQAMQRRLDALSRQNAAQQRKLNALETKVARLQSHHGVSRSRAVAASDSSDTPVASTADYYTSKIQPGTYHGYATTAAYKAPIPPSTTDAQPPQQLGTPGPQQQSVKSAYQQENAFFTKGLTVTPGVTYSYGDSRFFTLNGFMALGAIFLGNIDVSRQQNSVFSPNLNLTYAVNKHMEYDLTIPFVGRTADYTSAGAQDSSAQSSEKAVSTASIGDINAGFYYQLPQKRLSDPVVILNGHFSAPTGRGPYGVKIAQDTIDQNSSLSYAESLPTGQGVWGLSAGATIIKEADPAILFGGLTAYYNLVGHVPDVSPDDKVTQAAAVQPGAALSASVGTSFALNDRMSTSFSFQDTIVKSTRIRPNGQGWQTIAGSSLNAAVFNIGATFAVNDHTSWQTMLGIGLTQDAPNFQLTIRVPHT